MPVLSRAGRELNAILLICGVGVVGYAASIATRFIFEGELGKVFWRRRVRNRIDAMEGHYVLCGHGRVGRIVAEELGRHKVAFVVIEVGENAVADRVARGEDVILGDATDEKVLESAGVRRAKGLVAALQSDADNLYVTLTAREMNPGLRIVARATDDVAAAKLKRAGADRTISPNVIGGREMAQHLLMPAVVDFLHRATGRQNLDLEMREIHVRDASRLCGVPFSESPIRREHGVIVVAINRASGESVFNPEPGFVVGADDTLICLGHPERLAAMQKLAEQGA
jgi:K+ transport systems, NAD-binding component